MRIVLTILWTPVRFVISWISNKIARILHVLSAAALTTYVVVEYRNLTPQDNSGRLAISILALVVAIDDLSVLIALFTEYFDAIEAEKIRDDLAEAKRDSSDAKKRSEQLKIEVAEANRRAAEAHDQLEARADEAEKDISATNAKVEADRLERADRLLSEEQQNILHEKASLLGPQILDVLIIDPNEETKKFARQIAGVLTTAGWQVKIAKGMANINCGGVSVGVANNPSSETIRLAEGLISALNLFGIVVNRLPGHYGQYPFTSPVGLYFGEKPKGQNPTEVLRSTGPAYVLPSPALPPRPLPQTRP